MGRYQKKDLLACAKRELGYRRQVYPRRVESGRMTQEKADREIQMMEEIYALLEPLAREEAAKGDLFGFGGGRGDD